MEDLKKISYSRLVDMLADYTTVYLKMMAESTSSDKINTCKKTIDEIVEELRSRDNMGENTSSS